MEDVCGAPAAFRRLCVETKAVLKWVFLYFPAAFRRLCVETKITGAWAFPGETSRLQAAVC
ncbi:hypothetical protein HMPREF1051_1270 [Neisseria sicca VK64]|uniref:Uncharacterized protein n=1 Tax=Neisseria sicca VK64 TaxID=1095748 RepID=I2NX59_NEISI|nr:hypothetical protein HMPREF1051_1270 [Neisseria sicca VK64]